LWYVGIVIFSAGLLAAVPFAHAAQRLRRPDLWRWATVYGALTVVLLILMPLTPTDAQSNPIGPVSSALSTLGGLLVMAIMVISCIQLRSVRRAAYGLPAPPVPSPVVPGGSDPIVVAALAARERRQQARELAASDPMLARDLRIGRPDLSRQYDDGGLVDLNNAPAEAISQTCGLDRSTADKIVAVRDDLGGTLSNLDEVFVLADLPISKWEQIRDRAVLLPS
jgi:hypothetical protein